MEELELRQYWGIVRKRWLMIISIPVLAAIVSALLSMFVIKPQYSSDTTLLVNQKPTASTSTGVQYDDILASQALVKTYSDIIKSKTIEQAVIDKLGLSLTAPQLDGMISVSSPDQSEVIDVSVVSPSQSEATNIANSLAQVFQNKAQNLMNVQNVRIIDAATNPASPSPVKPNKKLNVAIAFILGLLVSLGIAFLIEYLDNRLKTEEEVRRFINYPVLGSILDYELDAK